MLLVQISSHPVSCHPTQCHCISLLSMPLYLSTIRGCLAWDLTKLFDRNVSLSCALASSSQILVSTARLADAAHLLSLVPQPTKMLDATSYLYDNPKSYADIRIMLEKWLPLLRESSPCSRHPCANSMVSL